MPKTGAERQAAYRARRFGKAEADRVRVDVVLTATAAARLARLARHLGVANGVAIALALEKHESEVLARMNAGEQGRYYSDTGG